MKQHIVTCTHRIYKVIKCRLFTHLYTNSMQKNIEHAHITTRLLSSRHFTPDCRRLVKKKERQIQLLIACYYYSSFWFHVCVCVCAFAFSMAWQNSKRNEQQVNYNITVYGLSRRRRIHNDSNNHNRNKIIWILLSCCCRFFLGADMHIDWVSK